VLDLEISHSSSMPPECSCSNADRGRRSTPTLAGASALDRAIGALRSRSALGKRNQLSERCLLECANDAALHPSPEQAGGAVLESVQLVIAEHAHLAGLGEALHRHYRSLERADDLRHRDLGGG